MEKRIPLWVLVLTIFVGLNLTVLYGWLVKEASNNKPLGKLESIAVQAASFPTLVKEALFKVQHKQPAPMLVPNRFPEVQGFKKEGVLKPGVSNDKGYLLLSVFDEKSNQSIVKLIRINDQKILYKWLPDINDLATHYSPEKYQTIAINNILPAEYRIGHPLLLKDGGLVFHNFEGPLYKINSCSRFEWVNNQHFHHSIEQDLAGNLWGGSVIEPTRYDKDIFTNYRDDAITQLSLEGKLLFRKSAAEILEENGYRGLLFGVGPYEQDKLHLNDVQPALYSTKYWQKNDLLISMRNISTVMLYRPSTNKIVWLQTGPWLNQHDADFEGDSTISVFGNNIVRNGKNSIVGEHNSIYKYNMADNTVSTPYDSVLKALDVRTRTEGRQEHIENGDIFIEEQNDGRILRISPQQLVWEFVAALNKDRVALLSWSRYLTEEQVKDILPLLVSTDCG